MKTFINIIPKFKVGDKVLIKPDAWYAYPSTNKTMGEHTVVDKYKGIGGRYTYLLKLINCWWDEADLTLINEATIYEEVKSIHRNGRNYRVGDRLRCTCRYEVANLRPVWDSKTGKHLEDHYNNSFIHKRTISCDCPVHRYANDYIDRGVIR